jgi:hypothetical protein
MRSYPAIYNHYRFDSRLEARYAFWFDLVGVAWRREADVIALSDNLTYIPDFYLTGWRCWVEVKGDVVNDSAGLKIIEKCEQLARQSTLPVILCFDDPLEAKCAIFHGATMYTPMRWTMCRYCGSVAIGIGETLIRCPMKKEHGAFPLDRTALRLRSRFLFDAATRARQRKFGWKKDVQP